MTINYSLEEFYNDIGNSDKLINKEFNKQTNLINFAFDDLLPDDIFQYLKNISKDFFPILFSWQLLDFLQESVR